MDRSLLFAQLSLRRWVVVGQRQAWADPRWRHSRCNWRRQNATKKHFRVTTRERSHGRHGDELKSLQPDEFLMSNRATESSCCNHTQQPGPGRRVQTHLSRCQEAGGPGTAGTTGLPHGEHDVTSFLLPPAGHPSSSQTGRECEALITDVHSNQTKTGDKGRSSLLADQDYLVFFIVSSDVLLLIIVGVLITDMFPLTGTSPYHCSQSPPRTSLTSG
ncbi:hypothetical protein XENOCAPTIV_008430 [Xenoophorus captivus]|uniref:Uncharacterized protein n=1 Tax=Xenoophorus captivus TaxID=1517983 RepID=A0ABV0S3K8_9TELE